MRFPAFVAVALTLFAACDRRPSVESLTPVSSADRRAAPAAGSAARMPELTPAQDGQQIFVANCTGCHGKNADGDTPAGRAWHVPDLHSQPVQKMADQQLLEIVRHGKGKMPAWGGLLSQIDMDHLLAYIRSLKTD
jgi:mono/diheme cytochrome c family protein